MLFYFLSLTVSTSSADRESQKIMTEYGSSTDKLPSELHRKLPRFFLVMGCFLYLPGSKRTAPNKLPETFRVHSKKFLSTFREFNEILPGRLLDA